MSVFKVLLAQQMLVETLMALALVTLDTLIIQESAPNALKALFGVQLPVNASMFVDKTQPMIPMQEHVSAILDLAC